jgi:hypothetical protein
LFAGRSLTIKDGRRVAPGGQNSLGWLAAKALRKFCEKFFRMALSIYAMMAFALEC